MGPRAARYEFGRFQLDTAEHRLVRDGVEIRLQPKTFQTLCLLVENANRLLTKEELLQLVWPDTVVEETNLTKNISLLRQALDDSYIETLPTVGYRFVAPVRTVGVSEPVTQNRKANSASEPLPRQEVKFATTADAVRLAWASTGDGPPLVKASNWLTHLDYEWESPIWRHWWVELGKHHRVIRYDERGNGMSQRDVTEVNFDTWVRDLETVVDAAKLERFALLGISRGGAIAIAYAAKHPERVSKLVLYGAFDVGLSHYGTPEKLEERKALVSLMRLGWGVQNSAFCRIFTQRFIPRATPVHEAWFDNLQRVSTSAENAARLMETDDGIDVRKLLGQLRVPTLVMHCDGDKVVAPEFGGRLAAEIPNARYVSLHSENHLLLAEEPAWANFLQEMGVFLEWQRMAEDDLR